MSLVWTLDPGAAAGRYEEAGGGSQPTNRELLSGDSVSIGNGASANLTWDTKGGGDDLLDLTDPASPTIVTAGTYAITVGVVGITLTADGFYSAELFLDQGGEMAATQATSSVASATNNVPFVSLTVVYYLPAGAIISVLVTNSDGVASRDFSINQGIVQRLS